MVTEWEKERVDTHKATGKFGFTEWKDMSDKIDILFFLEKLSAVRLHVTKTFRLSPKAEREHRSQKAIFIRQNQKDTFYDFKEEEKIEGMLENIGVYTDSMPCFFNRYILILLDIIALGWLQRLVMLLKTGETFFTIRKVIQM